MIALVTVFFLLKTTSGVALKNVAFKKNNSSVVLVVKCLNNYIYKFFLSFNFLETFLSYV